MSWTQAEAVGLCREIESVCPAFGCHVALTGGALYKSGPRKDVDILFYRVRQVACIDEVGLWAALEKIGLVRVYGEDNRWLSKATYKGANVDVFFPEAEGGVYDAQPALTAEDEFAEAMR